jgi:uncharacterized MAPEG superfamily protein
MTTAMYYLALSAAVTGLMWLPYILDRVLTRGLSDAVGYPTDPKPPSAWADRLKRAHHNAVENLVVFGVLVLVAHALSIDNPLVTTTAIVYFWARLVHVLAFTFKISWVRTLGFFVGFLAQAAVAWAILIG